jgi:hypothetical protein
MPDEERLKISDRMDELLRTLATRPFKLEEEMAKLKASVDGLRDMGRRRGCGENPETGKDDGGST